MSEVGALADEVLGLPGAFLQRGVPTVISSLWKVNDLSTSLLMERFYGDLGIVHAGKMTVDALHAAQYYVRHLTARQIIEHCERQIASGISTKDRKGELSLYRAKASAQVAAGDLHAALITYKDAQSLVDILADEHSPFLTIQIRETLELLEFAIKAERVIDYGVKPFSPPHFWAPFVLIGDWR